MTRESRKGFSGVEPKTAATVAGVKGIRYAAKSTKDVRGSIPDQLTDCDTKAESIGIEIVATYTDESATAFKGNRGNGLAEAMAHAERIAPCILLVQHTDRLARGDAIQARHLVEIYLWAIKHDVTIRSVEDDGTMDSLVLAAVMGDRNTADSKRKSEGVSKAHVREAGKGRRPGGRYVRYGYRRSAVEGELELVPDRAAVCRRVQDEGLAGRSLRAIVRGLKKDGIPSATGGNWSSRTVGAILTNPTYYGARTHKGVVVCEDAFPATWTKAEWERAQQIRSEADNANFASKPGRRPVQDQLFIGGKLRCGKCRWAMAPRKRKNGPVYVCLGHLEYGDDFCDQRPVKAIGIDRDTWAWFEEVGLDLEQSRRDFDARCLQALNEARSVRLSADAEVGRLEAEVAHISREFRKGDLSAKRYEPMIDEAEEELAGARAEADRLAERELELERERSTADGESEFLKALAQLQASLAAEVRDADSLEAQRNALGRLFKSFTYHETAPDAARVDVVGDDGEVVETLPEAGYSVTAEYHEDALDPAWFTADGDWKLSYADEDAVKVPLLLPQQMAHTG